MSINNVKFIHRKVTKVFINFITMKKRNLWRNEEIKCMLKILKNLEILRLLERKIFPTHDVYKIVETQMIKYGNTSKNSMQIQNKWYQLKSSYQCSMRDPHSNQFIPYKKEISQILKSQTDRPTTEGNNILHFRNLLNENRRNLSHPDEPNAEKPKRKPKQGSYKKSFSKLLQCLATAEREIQTEFINKQRVLLEQDRALKMERDRVIIETLRRNTNEILNASNLL